MTPLLYPSKNINFLHQQIFIYKIKISAINSLITFGVDTLYIIDSKIHYELVLHDSNNLSLQQSIIAISQIRF